MLSDTTRSETGSARRTSNNSHIKPSSSTANCLNTIGSSTRRQRRMDAQILQYSLQHHSQPYPCTKVPSENTHNRCPWCGYTHPCNNCPTYSKECYNCNGFNNFTALCKKPCRQHRGSLGQQSQLLHMLGELQEVQQYTQTKLFAQQKKAVLPE